MATENPIKVHPRTEYSENMSGLRHTSASVPTGSGSGCLHQQKYEDLVSTNDYSLSPKAAKAAPGLQLE